MSDPFPDGPTAPDDPLREAISSETDDGRAPSEESSFELHLRRPDREKKTAPRKRPSLGLSRRLRPTHTLPALPRRMLAGFVDLLLGLTVAAGLFALGLIDLSLWLEAPPDLLMPEHVALTFYHNPGSAMLALVSLWLPIVLVQVAAVPVSGRGIGARVFRLQLVDSDGLLASPIQATIRAVAYISWPLTLFFAPLMVVISREQRGLHDILAGVWVVNRPKAKGEAEGGIVTRRGRRLLGLRT